MKADKQMYLQEFGAIEGFTPFPSDANFILVRYPRSQSSRSRPDCRNVASS